MIGGGRVTRSGFVFAGGKLFALKLQPPKNQAMIVVLDGRARLKSERVVVDANVLDPTGKTAIDWFEPSLDGKRVAVSLSKNGSEDGTLYIFDAASGKQLPDVVPRVQYPTGGGSVAWIADGSGFYYTRYPQGTERPAEDANFYMQVYFHRLGTPVAQDEYVIGKDFPRIAEIKLSSSEDGKYLLADVANGDGGEHAFFVRRNGGKWLKISGYTDGFREAEFGRDGRLYALGLKNSPRGRIVALKLDNAGEGLPAATVVVPESEAVIESVVPAQNRLYVNYLVGGPSELRVFGLDGRPMGTLGAEPISSIRVGTRLGGDAILFGSQSFVRAFAWYAYDPAKRGAKPVKTRLSDAPVFAVNGGMPGVRGRARIREIQGRHQGSGQYHLQERQQARRVAAAAADRLRRLQTSRCVLSFRAGSHFGCAMAVLSPSPICAAAANTASNGISPATWKKSRTCSTISSPARNCWWSADTRRATGSRSKAAATAAC